MRVILFGCMGLLALTNLAIAEGNVDTPTQNGLTRPLSGKPCSIMSRGGTKAAPSECDAR